MRMIKSLLLIPLLLIGLVGCAEQKLLEKVGLTILVGYDLGNENDLSTTAVIRQVNPEFQSNIEVISAEDKTSKGSRTKINRKSSKKIVAGQLRVVLYGDEIAKQGIDETLIALGRDPNISSSIYMAVVEGESKTLLDYKYENIEDIGEHIFKLLQQNIDEEQIISTTLHEVSHDYHSIGEDIAMPILSREGETINISGMALFKKGQMVGVLPAEDGFYLKISRDRYDSGTFETTIESKDLEGALKNDPPKEISVVLDTIKSKNELKLINKSEPEFDLHITMNARLLELSVDMDLGNPKNIAIMEKAISESLSNEIMRVIRYCQEVNSDVFGLGQQYQSSVRNSNLTEEKWDEMYQKVKVNVEIDFNIIRSGTLN